MQHVAFTAMQDGTQAEYAFLHALEADYMRALPQRILASLERTADTLPGYQVNRLTHALQSAARAEADGADVDMVVGALVHDMGDELAPSNHAAFAAALLRPYVRAEVTWVVEKHALFQMQYYAHHIGQERDGRLRYRDHPWFDSCQHFCQAYDQNSFDPAYPTPPLAHFAPMVHAVFSRTPSRMATMH
ncbi:MAG: peptidase [Betaproteobacteria bacterium]|nr:peptidase [Betaproteobacteria bacterium]